MCSRTELRDAAAERQLSVRQAVTLASIVEKETAKAEERPLVAAVYVNRLRLGMPLQCRPDGHLRDAASGHYTGNLRRDDLMFDSPYNTVSLSGTAARADRVAGPGVARSRGASCRHRTALYFVSRNDGSHVFAKTLDEHNRNVQKYQVQYFRDLKAAKASGQEGQDRREGQDGQDGKRREGQQKKRRVANLAMQERRQSPDGKVVEPSVAVSSHRARPPPGSVPGSVPGSGPGSVPDKCRDRAG